jgi:toxin FitB
MMIILDTNVISELMRPKPTAVVAEWTNRQPQESLCVCAATIYELEFGIARLIKPEPKQRLRDAWDRVRQLFKSQQFIAIDETAATIAADIKAGLVGTRDHADILDCLIAGVAIRHNAILATRNLKHFPRDRLIVVDPWEAGD